MLRAQPRSDDALHAFVGAAAETELLVEAPAAELHAGGAVGRVLARGQAADQVGVAVDARIVAGAHEDEARGRKEHQAGFEEDHVVALGAPGPPGDPGVLDDHPRREVAVPAEVGVVELPVEEKVGSEAAAGLQSRPADEEIVGRVLAARRPVLGVLEARLDIEDQVQRRVRRRERDVEGVGSGGDEAEQHS